MIFTLDMEIDMEMFLYEHHCLDINTLLIVHIILCYWFVMFL